MAEAPNTHGLSCPNCGGMVPIPEGALVVKCPFCDLRSMVRGERGLNRLQVPRRISRDQALQALQTFLKGHSAIAGDAAAKSTLSEAFLAYVPFWTGWARVLSWVFGQKQVGSSKHRHYEAREVRIVQDMTWNGAACDVGEFGVESVPLKGQPLESFDAEGLHEQGLVFEPVGSASDARQAAEDEFRSLVAQNAKLDRVAQTIVRFVRQRFGLVYYPLWVVRYLYRGRSFQVVVDGFSGQTLYGKAPGNTLYRAAMLVGGMAAGSFLAVDVSSAAFYLLAHVRDDDGAGGVIALGLGAMVLGAGLMWAAYRKFRYGEQFEYWLEKRSKKSSSDLSNLSSMISQISDVEKWLDQLS